MPDRNPRRVTSDLQMLRDAWTVYGPLGCVVEAYWLWIRLPLWGLGIATSHGYPWRLMTWLLKRR